MTFTRNGASIDSGNSELRGLTTAEAERLLARHGPNALPEAPPRSLLRRLGRQLGSPIIYILVFALLFDLGKWIYDGFVAWPMEGLAILAILVLNVVFGLAQEYRSEQALARLKRLAAPHVWVRRDGALRRVLSRELVPGDRLRLEAGERVPADATLCQGHGLLVDESVLTGESMAVDKQPGDELSSGTLTVRGQGEAIVLRTGGDSNMGKLAVLLGEIEVGKTPLERRLDVFGNRVARWVAGIAAVVVTAGVAVEGLGRIDEWFLFAVALAVAVVPEGLPAVLTLTLALGVQRMAKRHAVVRRLSAVEALGSVTVIATDKTGTLTENRMVVHAVDAPDETEALHAMVLANDAETEGGVGDPLEIALIEHARARDLDVALFRLAHTRTSERAFDSAWKYMRATVAPDDVGYLKGAPEVLIARSTLSERDRAAWTRRAEDAAQKGYRVLALARGQGAGEDRLTFLGLVSLWDPPRPEVALAMKQAQDAGIRVVMVTGDHPTTARVAAEAIGLRGTEVALGTEIESMSQDELVRCVRRASVFARVSPKHKLRVVEALQADGEIVAVTGDGVNDAPALKRSDVGVAMGNRGSDVAREVADIVLTDDNFASIVAAVEEGRGIYENIQKFIRYTLSTNVALVLLLVGGVMMTWLSGLRDAQGMLFLPLSAMQILWINFIGDGPPALALALDLNPGTMTRPPRPADSGILDRGSLRFIVITGLVQAGIGAALLAGFDALGAGMLAMQTGVFLYVSMAKLVSADPARRGEGPPPRLNRILLASIVFGLGLQLATAYLPWLRGILALARPSGAQLVLVVGAVTLSWLTAVATSLLITRTSRPSHGAQSVKLARRQLKPIPDPR